MLAYNMVKSIWNNSQILVPRSFINITTKLEAPPPNPVQFLKFQPKDGKVWQSFFAVSKRRWRHSPRNPQNPARNWRFIKLRGLPVPTEPKDNQKTNIVNKQNKLGVVEQADWTIFFGKNDHMKASSSLVNKTYNRVMLLQPAHFVWLGGKWVCLGINNQLHNTIPTRAKIQQP